MPKLRRRPLRRPTPPTATTTTATPPTATTPTEDPSAGDAPRLRPRQARGGKPVPLTLHPKLTAGRYVFPVYGAVVVHRHLRRCALRRHLPPRRRHLRAARPAAPRGRGRDGLLGRLEQDRRQPSLAPRPAGKPVLLRAPLGVLDRGVERRAREGGPGRRLHGQHGRRGGNARAPPLRGASGVVPLPRLRRRRRSDAVPRRVEAPAGSAVPDRRRLGAGRCPAARRRRSRARSCSG